MFSLRIAMVDTCDVTEGGGDGMASLSVTAKE